MKSFLRAAAIVLMTALLPTVTVSADESKAETKKAPDLYKVKFETSCGDFVVEVHREWAPNGADRFHELVTGGFYDDCRFFRVVPGFVVQFGMNGDPKVHAKWMDAQIRDDKVTQSNLRGFLSFAAKPQPNTRTCQVFINFADNSRLDESGFAPFAKVVEGMEVVDSIYAKYGQKPNQAAIIERGNEYLKASFPKLDFIKKATVLSEEVPANDAK